MIGLLVFAILFGIPVGSRSQDVAEAFLDACRKQGQASQDQGNGAIRGEGGWLYLTVELVHMGKKRFWGPDSLAAGRAASPNHRDPLPVILDFADQLKRAGIHLILMPVPPKVVIHPERWKSEFASKEGSRRLDPYHREFYALLRSRGVDVLDLTDIFLEEKTKNSDPLYCRTDTHWSGSGCQAAAREAARKIRSLEIRQPDPEVLLSTRLATVEITGDLTKLPGGNDSERERIPLRLVERSLGDRAVFLAPDSESPVLILADSHGLVFQAGGDMHSEGAGFFDQLSLELGYPVDLIAVRGSGATPARINLMRRVQIDPGYFPKKKVVVWCFSAREFSESDGWRMVPVMK